MDKLILRDFTYGMFVLSTNFEGRNVGCFVNTVTQITSEEVIISVSVNKNNFTNKAIKQTKNFAVSVLSTETNPEVIGKFGFFTSKDINKFENFNVFIENGLPVVNEKICGYLICELINVIDVKTHDIFIARVIDAKKLNDFLPMTYAYYHKVIKGKAPKSAPTFVEETKTANDSGF